MIEVVRVVRAVPVAQAVLEPLWPRVVVEPVACNPRRRHRQMPQDKDHNVQHEALSHCYH